MKVRKVFLKPIHVYAFRHESGLYGEIKGVFLVSPTDSSERICYKVVWSDMEDFVAISDIENGNYLIVDTVI